MAVPNYDINYEDQRFKDVETSKQQELDNVNDLYQSMADQSNQFYDAQIQASKDYAEQQKQLQQEQTDHLIEQIEQQKDKAQRDYIKEQSGAYTDWQKQSNQYGVQAEQMAAQGLSNTGFSESSNVSMWNTYQNRVSAARDSYNEIVLDYDNGIKDAILANNSALAELAYNSLQEQLELALNGFQYKNDLLREQLQQQQSINDRYYSRWQDVVTQMNSENSLKEQIRQFEEQMAYQKQRDAIADKQWEKEYNLSKKSVNSTISANNATIKASNSASTNSNNLYVTKKSTGFSGYLSDLQMRALEKYGAFSGTIDDNGVSYQPKGVMYDGKDYGKVTKSSTTMSSFLNKKVNGKSVVKDIVNSSGVSVKNQNIWETPDGKKWIWNGTKMTYEPFTTKNIVISR